MSFRILVFSFALLFLNLSRGQGFSLPTDYVRNNVQGNNIKWEKVNGSPYLYDDFRKGTIKINDSAYNASLRYNAFNDEIELREENGQIISVLKRGYIKIAIGEDNLGIYPFDVDGKVKQGYFTELTESTDGGAILLKRSKKNLIPAVEATSSYKKGTPPRLVDEESYFLKLPGKAAVSIRLNRKSVLSAVDKDLEKLKAYITNRKTKLKSEIEVIEFINYYNTI